MTYRGRTRCYLTADCAKQTGTLQTINRSKEGKNTNLSSLKLVRLIDSTRRIPPNLHKKITNERNKKLTTSIFRYLESTVCATSSRQSHVELLVSNIRTKKKQKLHLKPAASIPTRTQFFVRTAKKSRRPERPAGRITGKKKCCTL